MTVVVFFAWDFLFIIVLTIVYIISPKKLVGEKYEYIHFLLVSLSLILFISIIVKNILGPDISQTLIYILVMPVLFLIHAIYPFLKVRRNKTVSFFLLCFSLYALLLFGGIVIFKFISNYSWMYIWMNL